MGQLHAISGRHLGWWRPVLGAGSGLLALAIAMAAALAARRGTGDLNGVEVFSAASTNLLSGLAAAVPIGYAFGAGMVSAVNPCGFVLLPTYLGLYLGSEEGGRGNEVSPRDGVASRLGRALMISISVTLSFVVLFGVVGLALGATTAALAAAFPWVGLGIGVLLVLSGAAMLGGGHLYLGTLQRLGAAVGSSAGRRGIRGYVAYGLAYGSCSLGCTLPIFLAVVGSGVVAGGWVAAARQFVLYALGMGFVLSVLTLGVAVLKQTVFGAIRGLGAYLEPASGLLLLATGAYVTYYWLALGDLLRLAART